MIGSGKNKKSMAYISNITEFLHTAIKADKKYALYNYVDTPDFTMNELVKLIRFQLTGKEAIGLRLPLFFGIFIGYLADLVSSIFGEKPTDQLYQSLGILLHLLNLFHRKLI